MAFTLTDFLENPKLIEEIGSKVEMICENCGSQFQTNRCRIRQNVKRGNSKIFCCTECSLEFLGERTVTVLCSNCGKPVVRSNSDMRDSKSGKVFCSRSCSATYNNKTTPKRKIEGKCLICGIQIQAKRTYCDDHQPTNVIASSTLGEVIKNSSNTYPSNRYRKVRGHAHNLAKRITRENNIDYVCSICGYSKFVDVCHIQDISKFPLNTTVLEINNPENLTLLCPNHHKEFDNNILDVKPPTLKSLMKQT